MDAFRVLGPREVAYLDLTGSGIETVSHLRENGRIVFMFCASTGREDRSPARTARGYGHAPEHAALRRQFPDYPGARTIVRASLTRISDSCGYSVPQYEYVGDRDTLLRWAESKGPDALVQYRSEKNARSYDGLPGLDPTV
jgi:hypothetical protein